MSYITLNKKNLFHNLDYFSKICGTKEKICAVLKDNAYGHGLDEIAFLVSEYGIKHICVRNLQEATIAKRYNFESILVFYDIPTIKDDNIIISVNSLEDIKKVPNKSKIELKIDTGMNRNGILLDQIQEAIILIKQKRLLLHGVFTHFCCSDESKTITQQQEQLLQQAIKEIKKEITNPFRIHCANSTGVFLVDMDQYDIARIGLGIYGYVDNQYEQDLKPVLSLYGEKITTKKLKKGDHIGYGSQAFIAPKAMSVSNYDIGYADGLFRANPQKKKYLANKLPILGRISMDSFFAQSTQEELCVFNDVTHLAQVHNTIKYEILTSLKPSLQKKII